MTSSSSSVAFRARSRARISSSPFASTNGCAARSGSSRSSRFLRASVGPRAPRRSRSLISQRARWQRVITETVWHYRRMLFNPRYGSVGLVGMPFYVLVEVLAPIFEVLSRDDRAGCLVARGPRVAWLRADAGAIALANGLLTNAALLMNERGRAQLSGQGSSAADAARCGRSVLYRPVLVVAQAKGLLDCLRGQKSWNKFERNHRSAARAGDQRVQSEAASS